MEDGLILMSGSSDGEYAHPCPNLSWDADGTQPDEYQWLSERDASRRPRP